MTNPRRVRKRYPKMPDVTIDEVDSPPPGSRLAPPSGDEWNSGDHKPGDLGSRPERGFRAYEGVVTAAVSIWLPGPTGRPAKYYDTRIRYNGPDGSQDLKITVPSVDFLAIGTKVDVEEQGASGRIRVHRRARPATTGSSWKRPDIKAAAIALAAILAITLVIGVIGYLIAKSKQTTDPPPAPSVTIQPTNGPTR